MTSADDVSTKFEYKRDGENENFCSDVVYNICLYEKQRVPNLCRGKVRIRAHQERSQKLQRMLGRKKKKGTTDAAAAACQKSRAAEVKNRRLALLQHSKDERTHPSPVKCRRRIGEDTKEAREDCHIPKNPTPPSFNLSAHSFFLSFSLSVVGRALRISSTA
jgi:hypothetical protein